MVILRKVDNYYRNYQASTYHNDELDGVGWRFTFFFDFFLSLFYFYLLITF